MIAIDLLMDEEERIEEEIRGRKFVLTLNSITTEERELCKEALKRLRLRKYKVRKEIKILFKLQSNDRSQLPNPKG